MTAARAQRLGQELLDIVRHQQLQLSQPNPVLEITSNMSSKPISTILPMAAAVPELQAELGSMDSVATEELLTAAPLVQQGGSRLEGDGDNIPPATKMEKEFDIDAFFAPVPVPPLPPQPVLPAPLIVVPLCEEGNAARACEVHKLDDPGRTLLPSKATTKRQRQPSCEGSTSVPQAKRPAAKKPPSEAEPNGLSEASVEHSTPAFDPDAFFSAPTSADCTDLGDKKGKHRGPTLSRPLLPLTANEPSGTGLHLSGVAAAEQFVTVPLLSPPAAGMVAPKVKPVKIRKSKPAPSAKKINSAETHGVTPGWFLDRNADAALKQYSREEDRWILDQVRASNSLQHQFNPERLLY